MNAIIVSERERLWTEDDKGVVEGIITQLQEEHGQRLIVISIGCDVGVGKHCLEFCETNGIKFAETRIRFHGTNFPRQFFGQIYKARNLSLLNVGDMFYIFQGENPRGLVAEIIELAKERVGPSRVKVYPYTPKST
jgi:hypothetical protein